MFIELSIEEAHKPVLINITNISSINGSVIKMNNCDILTLESSSLEALMLLVNPEDIEIPEQLNSKPNELSTLLNELHKLLGGRGEAKFTTDRKARLTTRLKDFSPKELKLAATNLGQDEFMQGANDSGKRYGTIDYLIRTSANINKWLEDQPEKKKPGMF